MKTNRQRVIEKLLELSNRMKDIREGDRRARAQITLAQLIDYDADTQGMPEEVFDAAIDVLSDAYVKQTYGWLQGVAETNDFADVREMLIAADIGPTLVDQIGRLEVEAPAPETAPEPAAARAYKAILESIQAVFRERLSRSEAVIVRSADAPIVDELARNAAHGVIAALEV